MNQQIKLKTFIVLWFFLSVILLPARISLAQVGERKPKAGDPAEHTFPALGASAERKVPVAWNQYYDHAGLGAILARLNRAFPELPTLAAGYQEYIAHSELALHRLEASRLEDRTCFAIRLDNLWGYYAVASEDPVLPPDLLPEDWPRLRAEELSVKIQRALAEPANRFFETIYETIGSKCRLS